MLKKEDWEYAFILICRTINNQILKWNYKKIYLK